MIGKYLNERKGMTALTFLSGMAYNLVTAVIPISFGRFYEFNFGFSSHRMKMLKDLPFINSPDFYSFVIFFICLILCRFLLEYANRYLIGVMGERFSKHLRQDLFAHQLKMSTVIYEEKGVGKYLLRYTGDFKSIQNYLTQGVFKFTQDIILILMLLGLAAHFNGWLAVIIAGIILLAFVYMFFMNKVVYRISLEKRNTHSGMVSYINKVFSSIISVKSFNKNKPIENRYNKRSRLLFSHAKRFRNVDSLIQASIPAITYLMIAAVMAYIYSIREETSSVDQASLLILILIIITFLPIFRRVLKVNIVWKLGQISFDKLLMLFDLDTEDDEARSDVSFKNANIHFREVILDIEGHDLKELNMMIFPDEITFIKEVPRTKEAEWFIKLMLKHISPASGDIEAGQYHYSGLSEKTIRQHVAVVSRLLPLEGRTVFEAISYSRKPEKKLKAQKLLDELQYYIPESEHITLDTKLGEKGVKLSLGQRLLLKWCRALLTRKDILIVEGGFAYFNKELKDYLCKKLSKLKQKRNIIVLDEHIPEGLEVDSQMALWYTELEAD